MSYWGHRETQHTPIYLLPTGPQQPELARAQATKEELAPGLAPGWQGPPAAVQGLPIARKLALEPWHSIFTTWPNASP